MEKNNSRSSEKPPNVHSIFIHDNFRTIALMPQLSFQLNRCSLSLTFTPEYISEESSYLLSTFVCLGLTNHLN